MKDELLKDHVAFTNRLGSNRAWSKLGNHIPPFSDAGVASADESIATQSIDRMKLDWVRWQKLEKLAADGDTDAKAIVKDCTWMCKKAVRLLHMLFEKDGWTTVSNAAQRYLRAFLFLPPDSKILEDTHNYLRDLARQGRSNMNSPQARATAAFNSGRIEERGIVHKKPDRTYFRGHYREAEMGIIMI